MLWDQAARSESGLHSTVSLPLQPGKWLAQVQSQMSDSEISDVDIPEEMGKTDVEAPQRAREKVARATKWWEELDESHERRAKQKLTRLLEVKLSLKSHQILTNY